MFESIGKSIDKGIRKVWEWNTQRIWYKAYAHLYISRKIKSGDFINYDHFNRFIQMLLDNNQMSKWQYHRLRAKYLKFH